jgi:hypothetical protein
MTKYLLWDEYHDLTKAIDSKSDGEVTKGIMEMMDEIGISDPDELDSVLLEVIADVQTTVAAVQVELIARKDG